MLFLDLRFYTKCKKTFFLLFYFFWRSPSKILANIHSSTKSLLVSPLDQQRAEMVKGTRYVVAKPTAVQAMRDKISTYTGVVDSYDQTHDSVISNIAAKIVRRKAGSQGGESHMQSRGSTATI